jgi:ATP-dependent Clp protease ATP-binding subunit ClpC
MSSQAKRRVGFSAQEREQEGFDDSLVAAARKALPPELYNRIDEVLPFAPLSRSDVLRIGRKLCQGLADEVELSRGVSLNIDDSALSLLLDQGGYDADLGARPLRRLIARKIEAPLAEALLTGELASGDQWNIFARDGELCFEPRSTVGAAE